MSKIRLAILDYDMTLIDTIMDFFDAINNARRYFGETPISFNDFMKFFISDSLRDYVVPKNIDERFFWKIFRRIYETRYGYPVKGANYLLYFLKISGSKVVIITGREVYEEKIWSELRRFNLHWGVDEVYTLYSLEKLEGVEEYLFDKTWLIKYVVNKHYIKPCEAVMLGDYWIDAVSSRNAGVPFIGVVIYPLRERILRDKGVEYIVHDLYSVIPVLREIEMKIKC